MRSDLRGPRSTDPPQPEQAGLAPDELRAERSGDLPARDAMSIIGVGGLEGGLPPPEILDEIAGSDLPVTTLPIDGPPVERYPVDPLPVDTGPVEPPVDDEPIVAPDAQDASSDASVKA